MIDTAELRTKARGLANDRDSDRALFGAGLAVLALLDALEAVAQLADYAENNAWQFSTGHMIKGIRAILREHGITNGGDDEIG